MKPTPHDINNLDDIRILVDSFYSLVRADNLLGPIFNPILANRWQLHLEKMYTFWQTVLLMEHTYYGSPFPPHAKLAISQLHFDKWLKLWISTIDQHFKGEKADEAKWRGNKMAEMFLSKIEYYKNSHAKPL